MNNNVGLVKFWKERFQKDSLQDWFSEFDHDISAVASDVQIDWAASNTNQIIPNIIFKESKWLKVTDSKQRHYLHLNWREAKNGITFPVIRFFSHADGAQWWNGYDALLNLFDREDGRGLSDPERDRLHAKRLKQEAEQKEKKDRAEKLLRIKEKHTLKHRQNYKARWEQGEFNPELIAQHSYLVKKAITPAVIEAGENMPMAIVTGREFHKNDAGRYAKQTRSWLGIPMQNFMGAYVGQQRIYQNGKAHARGSDMAQAHYIIGNADHAKQIEYVEGYATGASIYKTAILENKQDDLAVIVCFDKRGLTRIVKHYQQKWKAKKHIVRADNDHFKWLEGKGNAGMLAALELQHSLGCQATYPNFDNVSINDKPTDFNDLELLGGRAMTAKQLWGNGVNRLKADKNLFEYKLQLLRLTGQGSWKKYAKEAAACGAFLVPDQLNRKTVLNAIFESIPSMLKIKQGEKKSIANHLSWLVNKRFDEAAATKNFSADILKQDNINHIKVEAVLDPKGHYVIPSKVLGQVKSLLGATILKAPHGCGKTEKVMGPLIREAKDGASMVVHRVTLANQMSNELKVQHYKDLLQGWISNDTKFVTCVNSMTQPKFDNFFEQAGLLCVDEATQVLRHVMGGRDAIHAPVKAYNKLITAARSADKVLLADADANDSLVEFLQQARPGQMINVIEVVSPAVDLAVKYCDNVEFVFHRVMQTAKANALPGANKKRILVATDTKSKAEAVAQGIKKEWPEARVLCVTSQSKGDPECVRFSNDPNAEAQNIDVLIYSPVISSGVSIKLKTAAFDAHFGLFHGVVVPSDILQMMRRDRNASQFLVGFKPNHEKRQTDRDAMVRGLLNAHQLSASKLNWSETDTEIAIQKTPFDDMFLDVKISEAKARNSYGSHTLMLMAAEGWKIERIDVDSVEAAVGKMEVSASKDMVTLERHAMILEQITPEESTYQQLKRRELITQQEAAQITRYEIENQLGANVSADTIDFFDKRGLSKVRRLELLQSTQQQAEHVEQWEQNRNVVLTQRRLTLAKWSKLTWIFKTLGLDPQTGAGQFNVEQARLVMNGLTGNPMAIDDYNVLNIGPQVIAQPTCPTRFVKAILERFVPVVNGKKVQGVQFYRFNAEKFTELQFYVEARQTLGQHSLKVDSDAELHDDNHDAALAIKTAQASEHAAFSEGGETIDDTIYIKSEFTPQQEALLLELVEWIKPVKDTNQQLHETGAVSFLWKAGPRTKAELMSLARGWQDPQCEDPLWGDVIPMQTDNI